MLLYLVVLSVGLFLRTHTRCNKFNKTSNVCLVYTPQINQALIKRKDFQLS